MGLKKFQQLHERGDIRFNKAGEEYLAWIFERRVISDFRLRRFMLARKVYLKTSGFDLVSSIKILTLIHIW